MAGKLIYLGPGWIPGIPASDHEEPNEEKFQANLASGLYRSESGKEIRDREAVARRAKTAANTKAADGLQTAAVDARSEATSASRAAERLGKAADEAESKAAATASRRGGK